MAKYKPIGERVREYLGRKLVPPDVAPLPGGAAVMTAPARFDFGDGEHSKERERLARAAAKASGIVPTPEDLTAEVMAAIEQANAQLEGGGPPA